MTDQTIPPLPPRPPQAWRPDEDALANWAKILINDAYLRRPRIRCSREDFTQAAIAMLLALGWRSAFLPEIDVSEALRQRFCPLPGLVEAMVGAGPDGPKPGSITWQRYVETDNSRLIDVSTHDPDPGELATIIRAQTGVDPRE